MLRFLADEDFNNRIVRAIRRSKLRVDCLCVQDVGLRGCDDDSILQFAADQQRVVITRDVSTMTASAHRRVAEARPMPGLIVVTHRMAIGQAVDELIFLAEESSEDEWTGQVIYLPL